MGDKPRVYSVIDLQSDDIRFLLWDLATYRSPLTDKALSDCGIQTQELRAVRVAIGEPFRIRVEVDGAINIAALTCYLGDTLMDGLRARRLVFRDRRDGIAVERDLDVTAALKDNKLAFELERACQPVPNSPGCFAARLGPSGRDLVISSRAVGGLAHISIGGLGLGDGAAMFEAAFREVAGKLTPDAGLSAHNERGVLELTFPTAVASQAAFVLRNLLAESFKVSSSVMMPTLHAGDHLLIARSAFHLLAQPGDLIEYESKGFTYISRFVARAGQTIEETPDGISIDGTRLRTELVAADLAFEDVEGRSTPIKNSGAIIREIIGTHGYLTVRTNPGAPGTWTVPDKQIFVLGDNRNNANDSRFSGPVFAAAIHGPVLGIWFAMGPDGPEWDRMGTRPD